MAEKTTAKIVITAEGDKAVSAAKKVQKELKATGSAGKKAGADVDAGADKGAAGLKKMDSSAGKAEGALTTLSVSVLGLGASITGLSDAILGFNEKTVALERSTFGLKEMTIQVAREQEDLAKAIQEGTMSAEDEKRAIEDLGLSMEALAIEERTVKAEAEALSGEWVSFAINTATTVVQSLVAVTSMLALKTAGTATATGATAAHTGSNWSLVASLKAAAGAMKAFMLSNPITAAALIASTAAVAAYETNLGGMRDGIEDMMGMERGSLPTLTGGFIDLSGATQESSEAAVDWAKRAEEIANQARTNLVPQIDEARESFGELNFELKNTSHEAKNTTQSIDILANSVDRLKKKRPLDIITDSAVDANILALSAVAQAEKKLRDAAAYKGVIDASMMDALVQAEEAGIIAKGTAGQYKAAVKRSGGGVSHFDSFAWQSMLGSGLKATNIYNLPIFSTHNRYGDSKALIDLVNASGVGRGKATDGAGNRLRKRGGGRGLSLSARAKEARRLQAQSFQMRADILNSFFGEGAGFGVGVQWANRMRPSFVQSKEGKLAFNKLGLSAGSKDLIGRTGINVSDFFGQSFKFPIFGRASRTRIIHNGRRVTHYYMKLRGYETITTGASGRARLGAVALANAEAKREVDAFNALVAFNPNFSGMNLAASGINTSYLTQKLTEEQTRIGNMIDRYGFNKTEIVTMESTQQGNVVLNGMMDFRERMGLISGGIV